MDKQDGGPAFPHNERNDDGSHHVTHCGMDLRDWFAGQDLSNPGICRRDDKYPQRTAYAFADAMLQARCDG